MKLITYLFFLSVVFFTTCYTPPDPCDCGKNALRIDTPDFNQSLQTECEEYGKTLNEEDRDARAAKALQCIQEDSTFINIYQGLDNHSDHNH